MSDPVSSEWSDVEIGPLPAELIASFHRAVDVVARERRFLTFLEAPSLDSTRRFVFEGRAKNDVRLVATTSTAGVVGWCDICRHAFPAKLHRGILGMGLLPAFRGRGLGLRLLSATLNEAWSSGFSRVELDVFTDNAPAIALYRKVGFVDAGIIRDAVCVEGVYRDAIAMAMLRRPDAGL